MCCSNHESSENRNYLVGTPSFVSIELLYSFAILRPTVLASGSLSYPLCDDPGFLAIVSWNKLLTDLSTSMTTSFSRLHLLIGFGGVKPSNAMSSNFWHARNKWLNANINAQKSIRPFFTSSGI